MKQKNKTLNIEEAETAALCIRLVIGLWGHIDHNKYSINPGFLTHVHSKLDSHEEARR